MSWPAYNVRWVDATLALEEAVPGVKILAYRQFTFVRHFDITFSSPRACPLTYALPILSFRPALRPLLLSLRCVHGPSQHIKPRSDCWPQRCPLGAIAGKLLPPPGAGSGNATVLPSLPCLQAEQQHAHVPPKL